MLLIYIIIVLANIFAAPGYLSLVNLETDRNIVILSTISVLAPLLLLILYPHSIMELILGQILYMTIGGYLTMNPQNK
jgi:hypothetical protein